MNASSTTAEEKARLRRQVRAQLSDLSPEELRESDQALFEAFLALPQVKEARSLFLFWGIPGREPETEILVRTLTARGKRVGLPRMLPGRGMEVRGYASDRPLVPAAFGLLEPDEQAPLLERAAIDLILVPGLCYDREGYRLGFGGGYYDRWLAGCSGWKVGLCRAALLQDRLPRGPYDIPVDLVVTEEECLSHLSSAKSGG